MKVPPAPPVAGKDSPELRAAITEAKAASDEFGATSTEAVLAWETVEEIASAGVEPALGGMLDDECLIDTIEACEALQELNKGLWERRVAVSGGDSTVVLAQE